MKTYSKLFEAKQTLDIQDNSVNYLSKKQIEDYLSIAGNFISDEAKEICKWLIDNNDTYIKRLGKGGDNALADFYNDGVPPTELKQLYKLIGTLSKKNRLIEVPVFMTKEQVNGIIDKTLSPDMVILDLNSEAGRAAAFKKYEALIHKICRQYVGKSNLSYEELLSAGQIGFVHAMNTYGKRGKNAKATDEAIVGTTFGQYAAYIIRTMILEDIKNLSRVVRVPVSQQNKERKETGHNTRNNSISGDKTVGNDDENSKTLFDFMDVADDDTLTELDRKDLDKIWKEIYDTLEKNFDKKTMDIWYDVNGVNGHEKQKNKDIAKKYGVVPSNINYYVYKVNQFIQNNKEVMDLFTDAYELMKECLHDEDMRRSLDEPIRFGNLASMYI